MSGFIGRTDRKMLASGADRRDVDDNTKKALAEAENAAYRLDRSVRDSRPSDHPGADVLDAVVSWLRLFVAYPDPDSPLAHALWIAHCWFADLLFTTPRLAFVSPEKRSGKTRAQEVTALLVPNAVNVVNVSAAYLFRRIQDRPDGMLPVIELDETDALFTGKPSESTEQIRGIINAGYRQGATVGRAEATKTGEVKTIDFPVFAPVCLAGIGDMPDTIEDRSIIVHMKRRRPDQKLHPYRDRIVRREVLPLRKRLESWAGTARGKLTDYKERDYPELPDTIQDRDADVWEPLYIVAQLAGGHWPQTVQGVSQRMVRAQHDEPQSLGERLLRDIRTVMDGTDAIYRQDLIDGLREIEGSPWSTLGKSGEGIDSWFLTKTLRKYDVAHDYDGKAHSIRIGGLRGWGYYRSDFTDAWSRYLPPDTPSEKYVTPVTPVTSGATNPATTPVTTVTTVTRFPQGVSENTELDF